MSESRQVGIVGAGLGGAMIALYLARRGFEVSIFERRGDLRRSSTAIASMNLGLSRRGIEALERVGLLDEVLALAIPMHGRVIHRLDGTTHFQPYGKDRWQVIHAIGRSDINLVLVEAVAALPNVTLHFDTRCVGLERDTATLKLQHVDAAEPTAQSFDFVVGTDGVFSKLRPWMQRGRRADFSREYLSWGWKEIRVPPGPGGSYQLEKHAFNLWPRGDSLLFAHPNRDGSFTCSLVMPYRGEVSFEALETGDVEAFFRRRFPDLVPLIPDLVDQFHDRPILDLVGTKTSPWSYRDRVVLLGDAAHGVVPFYAQGMNAAFEDCAVLDQAIARHPDDLARAFTEYEAARKPNTDALAEMSKNNFIELRDTVRSPGLRLRKLLDQTLHRLLGPLWMPLHARVTNTTVPYAEALAMERRQKKILKGVLAAGLVLLIGRVAGRWSGRRR